MRLSVDPGSRWRGFRFPLLCLVLVLLASCSKSESLPPPKTFPAKGKVLTKTGQPVSGGMIEIVSAGDPPRSARSEIEADGSFSLWVIDIEGTRYDGAEEGEYTATYIPRMSEQQTEQPVTLRTKVRIQPGENNLELRLP